MIANINSLIRRMAGVQIDGTELVVTLMRGEIHLKPFGAPASTGVRLALDTLYKTAVSTGIATGAEEGGASSSPSDEESRSVEPAKSTGHPVLDRLLELSAIVVSPESDETRRESYLTTLRVRSLIASLQDEMADQFPDPTGQETKALG